MQFFRVLRNKMGFRQHLQTTALTSGIQDTRTSMNLEQAIQNALGVAPTKHPGLVLFGQNVPCVQFLGKNDRLELGVGSATPGSTSVADLHIAEEWIVPPFDQTFGCTQENIFQYKNRTIIARNESLGGVEMNNSQSSNHFIRLNDVTVVMPRCPDTAKGLLLSCLDDKNPCVFLVPENCHEPYQEVPKQYYTLPLRTAEIISEGTQVTLIGFGTHVNILKDKADKVNEQFGFPWCEVIDLRTLLPWDQKTVIGSVKKTGRCIIFEEPSIIKGLVNEIEDTLQKENEKDVEFLKAPIIKVLNSAKISFNKEEWRKVFMTKTSD